MEPKEFGYEAYISTWSQEKRSKYQKSIRDVLKFGNVTVTATQYTDYLAMIQLRMEEFRGNNFYSPRVSKSTMIPTLMRRQFEKAVNKKLFDMTNYKPMEAIATCTFGMAEDCRKSDKWIETHGIMSCFRFNTNGSERVNSSDEGLDLTMYKNKDEKRGSSRGIDSFIAFIHEPNQSHPLLDPF